MVIVYFALHTTVLLSPDTAVHPQLSEPPDYPNRAGFFRGFAIESLQLSEVLDYLNTKVFG